MISILTLKAAETIVGVIVHTVSEKLRIFECFCFAQKKLLRIRTDKGICKSWMITFSIKKRDSDGVYYVHIKKEDGSRNKEVILGSDGVVRVRASSLLAKRARSTQL
ncbi:hypothetical protein OSTOST_02063, partial [Ostertagia ostertagi]